MTKQKSVQIIKATPKDYHWVREISRITWLDIYPNSRNGITRQDIQEEFDLDNTEKGKQRQLKRQKLFSDPKWRILLAKTDNRIVGFFMGQKRADYNRLVAIYVLPTYQNQGIGTKLIRRGLKWLGREKKILVNVASYNLQAISFYQKVGFSPSYNKPIEMHRPLPSGKVIPEIEMILT